MTKEQNNQLNQMINQGKQQVAGMVKGGEMLIDAEPESGFFRVKLKNVQPPEMVITLTSTFCLVLASGGSMFGLQVKQYIRKRKEADG